MIIGIDIDEVLADLHTQLFEWHNKTFGTNITRQNHTSYDLAPHFQCTRKQAFDRVREFLSRHIEELLPVEGAAEALKRLGATNTLYTITSRMPEFQAQTNRWIDANFNGAFKERLFCTGHDDIKLYLGKAEMCRAHGIQLLIDDCLQYANECSDSGIPALLFDLNGAYGWNKGALNPLVARVHSWREAEEQVKHCQETPPCQFQDRVL